MARAGTKAFGQLSGSGLSGHSIQFTDLISGKDSPARRIEGKTHGFFNGSHFRAQNGDEAYSVIMKPSIDFLTEHGLLSLDR